MKKNKKLNLQKEDNKSKNNSKPIDAFEKYSSYFIISALLLILIVLVKTAWLCDDAFITYRTMDNFVNGFGLRYNVIERVQAYTHPLWLFIITIPYFFSREPFYTPILVSILLTLAGILFVAKNIASSKLNSFLFILAAIVSKSFIDYSTSGLENPLSHFIAIIFIFVFLKYELNKKKILMLSFIASLALLNRMDSILFYIPAIIYQIIESKDKRNIFIALIGVLPFILWTLFSIVYYGYPFPNTYYAKLNTGIPKLELVSQSFYYFYNSLKFDPFTLIIIFTCLVYVIIKREKKYLYLGMGIILYLLYIIYIGGDFMSGRFFSLPFIVSLVILSSIVTINKSITKKSITVIIFLFMFLSPDPPVLSGINYSDSGSTFLEEQGVSNERGYYYSNASLWKAMNGIPMPDHQSIKSAKSIISAGEKVFLAGAIGYFGYYLGPSVYVIDVYSLADPLLSKYHIVKYDPIFGGAYERKYKVKSQKTWRIGHFLRSIPPGYTLSILKNESLLDDPKFNELYNKVKLITQSDIFSAERLSTIWKMNTGQYDYLVDHNRYPDYEENVFNDDLVRYRPDFSRYYYARANYFYKRKKYDKSVPDFEKAVSLDQYFSLAWYKLAISQFFVGKYEKALSACKNAKLLKEEVDPEFEKVLLQKINEKQQSKQIGNITP